MNKRMRIIVLLGIVSLLAIAFGCGGAAVGSEMKTIMEKKVNDKLTVTLSSPTGKLKNGQQDLTLAFTDGSGKPVDIKAAKLNFNMPAMGSMAEMNDPATLTTTDTNGRFKGTVKLQMGGDWIAQISWEGAESGNTTMKLTALN